MFANLYTPFISTVYFFDSIPGLAEFAGPKDVQDRAYEANLLVEEKTEEDSYNLHECTVEED